MNVFRRAEDLVLDLTKGEERLLRNLLRAYPCIPSGARPPAEKAPQSSSLLLEQSLGQFREHNTGSVQKFLADPQRWVKTAGGCRVHLKPAEVEWLLQILNEVHVGSWMKLGSPTKTIKPSLLNEKTAATFWLIEQAELFQSAILDVLEKPEQSHE